MGEGVGVGVRKVLHLSVQHVSRLNVHLCDKNMNLGQFPIINLWACHTIFLDQNLMGNSKIQEKIQNSYRLPSTRHVSGTHW